MISAGSIGDCGGQEEQGKFSVSFYLTDLSSVTVACFYYLHFTGRAICICCVLYVFLLLGIYLPYCNYVRRLENI